MNILHLPFSTASSSVTDTSPQTIGQPVCTPDQFDAAFMLPVPSVVSTTETLLPGSLPPESVSDQPEQPESDPHNLLILLLAQPAPHPLSEPPVLSASPGWPILPEQPALPPRPVVPAISSHAISLESNNISRPEKLAQGLHMYNDATANMSPGVSNSVEAMKVTSQHVQETISQTENNQSARLKRSDEAVYLPVTSLSTPVSQALIARQIDKSTMVKIPTVPEEQGKALQQALGERLQMQVDSRRQLATIRLDPPSLGKLDISLHFEAGKLQVHIQAQQPEIARSLQHVSHELRVALSENNNVQVNVQVSTQNGDGRQQSRHSPQPETQHIVHSNEEVQERPETHRTDGTILTTV
ncbi:flagellar hook-length control protein FliK [Enterobacteriaceae bacterium LUAb1]